MTKKLFVSALVAALLASPVVADETEGHIRAYDRVAGLIVLTDKTVWQLPADMDIPADLGAGDRVHFEFDSEGEEGITKITGMHRLAAAIPAGTDGGS